MNEKDAKADADTRIEAMKRNIEWLEDNGLSEKPREASKRIGLIEGDCGALLSLVGETNE